MKCFARSWPVAVLFVSSLAALRAQCPQTWTYYPLGVTLGGALVNVGREWDPDGAGPAAPRYVCAGSFTSLLGGTSQSIAAYDIAADAWYGFGAGLSYEVDAIAPVDGGALYAGGGSLLSLPPFFFPFGTVDRWNGTNWTNVGSANNYVWDLLVLPDGDLVAGGSFTSMNTVAVSRVARWNGVAWQPMGLPGQGIDGRVMQFAMSPAGELHAVGWFQSIGGVPSNGGIARWDGASWQSLPSAGSVEPSLLTSFVFRANGNIVATGAFAYPGTIPEITVAEWNGTGWDALGTGPDDATVTVQLMPNGDVVVGGGFQNAGGQPANNVARWDGSSWSGIAGSPGMGPPQQVLSLLLLSGGQLMAGGAFGLVPGIADHSLASLVTDCPASVANVGSGCAGSGGTLSLTAVSLPWLGSTFESSTTGMAIGSIGLAIWGSSSVSLPLAAAFPVAAPGCTIHASPNVIDVAVVTGSAFAATLPLPSSPALAGQSLQHQALSLQLSGAGITSAATSNGLTLTLGAF
jgi:hypothetical protein